MSYEIKIKGMNDLLMIESEDVARRVKSSWESFHSGGENCLIEIEGWEGRVSSIDYFKKSSSPRSDNSHAIDASAEYARAKIEFLKLAPADKARKAMGFFRLMYLGFTGKRSEEVLLGSAKPIEEAALGIMERFYRSNPGRYMPDPGIFKAIIRSQECSPSAMAIMERQVMSDRNYSRTL